MGRPSNSVSTVIQLWKPINLRNPEDGDDTFYETSVRSSPIWYKDPEGIFSRLRLFENKVLRRIFGPKRDEVMGGWRKLHNGELRDLCSSPIIIRII
jgi:hypothetical protein